MSKTYTIPVKYVFEGTFTIKADSLEDAVEMIDKHCGLVLGGDIHTILDGDDVNWDFHVHPETIITDDPDEIEESFGTAYFQFKLPHDMTPEQFVMEMNETDIVLTHPLIQDTELEEVEHPYVLVKAYFECDQTGDEVAQIADDMNYNFGHMEHLEGELFATYKEYQPLPESDPDPLLNPTAHR